MSPLDSLKSDLPQTSSRTLEHREKKNAYVTGAPPEPKVVPTDTMHWEELLADTRVEYGRDELQDRTPLPSLFGIDRRACAGSTPSERKGCDRRFVDSVPSCHSDRTYGPHGGYHDDKEIAPTDFYVTHTAQRGKRHTTTRPPIRTAERPHETIGRCKKCQKTRKLIIRYYERQHDDLVDRHESLDDVGEAEQDEIEQAQNDLDTIRFFFNSRSYCKSSPLDHPRAMKLQQLFLQAEEDEKKKIELDKQKKIDSKREKMRLQQQERDLERERKREERATQMQQQRYEKQQAITAQKLEKQRKQEEAEAQKKQAKIDRQLERERKLREKNESKLKKKQEKEEKKEKVDKQKQPRKREKGKESKKAKRAKRPKTNDEVKTNDDQNDDDDDQSWLMWIDENASIDDLLATLD